jgi:hypothetical protein
MSVRNIWVPLLGVLILLLAWRAYGWGGVAAATGGLVMWGLLHVTRVMQVMQRAARRPIGHVDSAVMLNARLRAGLSLLHVLALTRALGQQQSEPEAQPEVYRWTDEGGSQVTAEFFDGRLRSWQLWRPAAQPAAEPASPPEGPA